MAVKPIPEGYHSVTPYLRPRRRHGARLLREAFGAVELFALPIGGMIGHAEIKIGDSRSCSPTKIPRWAHAAPHARRLADLADGLCRGRRRACSRRRSPPAAKLVRPVADQFYGDRTGGSTIRSAITGTRDPRRGRPAGRAETARDESDGTQEGRPRTDGSNDGRMNPALAAVLSNPAIWRGGDCAPEPAALPSGFPALDAVLPGRGWPGGALTEMLLEREGIGELAPHAAGARAAAGAGPRHRLDRAAASCRTRRRCRGRARPRAASHRPLPDSADAAVGLRAGAARARMRRRVRVARAHDERLMRRLAVAAREGRTLGRAVAASRPACGRHRRAAAALASRRGRREPARGARAEAPRRRSRAAGPRST